LARFLDDGTGDATFGDDATFGANSNKVIAGFAFGYDAALAGALQTDGDIVAGGGSNQAVPPSANIDFALARFTGPGATNLTSFKAKVHDLPDFQLTAKPETFPVSWSPIQAPGNTSTFDVRTRTARFYQAKYGDWQIILTKTKKVKKELTVTPGTTICIEARAHSGGFTSAWSPPKCTATPVDDRTLDQDPKSAWGEYTRPDCYRNTYVGNGHGTGAELHLEAVFKHLALVVAKGDGFGTMQVRVNGALVKTISLQAAAIHCGVLVPVKTYTSTARRDIDIRVVKAGSVGNFVDGVGASFD
jgi:hypothetical protein